MADEQRIRLALEILGAEGVTDLRQRLAALGAEGGELAAALGRGEISAAEFDAEMKQLSASARQLESALGGLEKTAKKAKGGVAGLGQTFLQSGRAVQDFAQGGIGGVLNNIEGVTAALGLGSGLAGVLTIVGVAAYTAGPLLKSLWEALNPGAIRETADEVERLKGRIKELEEKPTKLAVDLLELDNARERVEEIKAALAAVGKLENTQARAEKESGAAIDRALAEAPGGGDAVRDKLRAQLAPQAEAASIPLAEARRRQQEARDELAAIEGGKYGGSFRVRAERQADAENQLKAGIEAALRAKEEIDKDGGVLDKMLGQVLQGATQGGGAVQAQAQRQLAGLLERAGLGGVAADVRANSPANVRKYKQAEDDFKAEKEQRDEEARAQEKAAKEQAKAEKEQAKAEKEQRDAEAKAAKEAKKAKDDADKELVDALNQQGTSNEKEGKAKLEAEDKAVEVEQKKIESTVGKTYQRQYEIATATNNAAIATGDPRAMDPARLAAQLRNEIYTELRRRRATPEAAKRATDAITGKGDTDLSRRATDAAGQNLSIAQGTLAVQHQLISEFERMSTTQRELVREVRDQQRRMKSNQRTALKR